MANNNNKKLLDEFKKLCRRIALASSKHKPNTVLNQDKSKAALGIRG